MEREKEGHGRRKGGKEKEDWKRDMEGRRVRWVNLYIFVVLHFSIRTSRRAFYNIDWRILPLAFGVHTVWGRACELAFLTSSQVKPRLVAWRPPFGSTLKVSIHMDSYQEKKQMRFTWLYIIKKTVSKPQDTVPIYADGAVTDNWAFPFTAAASIIWPSCFTVSLGATWIKFIHSTAKGTIAATVNSHWVLTLH